MDQELYEWFRVDRGRGTRQLLVTGGALVFVGGGLVSGGFLTHQSSTVLSILTLTGASFLAFGLIFTFVGMAVLLAHDEYVAVRADGIVFHSGRADELFLWAEIEQIAADDEGASWSIHRASSAPHVVNAAYAGVTPGELAAHLEQLRLKARIAPLDSTEVGRVAIGLPHKRPGAARF